MILGSCSTGSLPSHRASAPDSFVASLALSIKMSILLYLPALVLILTKRKGLFYTIRKLVTITGIQSIIALPFIQEDWRAYLRSSFDLSRVFLYKWTVNWRMVPEDVFLHPRWSTTLLIGHVSVLLLFGIWRWCNPDGGFKATVSRALRRPAMSAGLSPVSADCESLFHIFLCSFTQNCPPQLLPSFSSPAT